MNTKLNISCYKCQEKFATLECKECDEHGLKLCYNCDIAIHEHSFKSIHKRTILPISQGKHFNASSMITCFTPRMHIMKPFESLKCGINTPRGRIEDKPVENDYKNRNSSLGSKKKIEYECKPILKKHITKDIPIRDTTNEIRDDSNVSIKYHSLMAKKDQVIESMKGSIESLKLQLSHYQNSLIDSQSYISGLKSTYNEDLSKIKKELVQLEQNRGHSVTMRNSSIHKDDPSLKTQGCIESIASQAECSFLKDMYNKKYDALTKEKESLRANLLIVKDLLKSEENAHKKTKERLNTALREIGQLRMALAKHN